jgi:hypothetical protein
MVRNLSAAALFALLVACPMLRCVAAEVQVNIQSNRATISNPSLSIEFSLANRRAHTALIRNLRSGKSLPVEGDDFALEFVSGRAVRAADFLVERSKSEPAGASGKRLVLALRLKELRVRMLTEMRADEDWATRWLEIQGAKERLSRVSLAHWPASAATGPAGPGKVFGNLGLPSGLGQAVYAQDLFLAIAHPGAENFAADGFISCRIPAYDDLSAGKTISTRKMIIGAGEAGAARHAFFRYLSATRAVASRMFFLVNDWYWKDKSKPVQAIEALAGVKKETGVPIDTFTLDDGWDFDWDETSGLWGRLNRQRFPGGWEALEAAGRSADIGVSLWFGPIGGYRYRKTRVEAARKFGFEVNGDKLCLAGTRYRQHAVESFSRWASLGMNYIKVDGFWPDCQRPDHGHLIGPSGVIEQMDLLMDLFASWRRANPKLLIAYTSGSNPSPFWLQHADYIWRGGADSSHAGAGEPFDRHNTFIDTCLQVHRATEVPTSAFVTFDIVQNRTSGNLDNAFERGVWWLAARTSLHHDWYVQATDLTTERWKMLAQAAQWARRHESVFQYSRMVGGNPQAGEIYGISSFDSGRGTLALRNPGTESRSFTGTLAAILELPEAARPLSFRLNRVFGETRTLEGVHKSDDPLTFELPPLGIAVFEVEQAR